MRRWPTLSRCRRPSFRCAQQQETQQPCQVLVLQAGPAPQRSAMSLEAESRRSLCPAQAGVCTAFARAPHALLTSAPRSVGTLHAAVHLDPTDSDHHERPTADDATLNRNLDLRWVAHVERANATRTLHHLRHRHAPSLTTQSRDPIAVELPTGSTVFPENTSSYRSPSPSRASVAELRDRNPPHEPPTRSGTRAHLPRRTQRIPRLGTSPRSSLVGPRSDKPTRQSA